MPLWMRLLRDLAEPKRGWVLRRPRVRSLACGPTLAALDRAGGVPWCAPGVWVAAEVRTTRPAGRSGFALAGLTNSPVSPCEVVAAGGLLRLVFRAPNPGGDVTATLLWRGRAIGRAELRVTAESAYRAGLHADCGVVARLGDCHVAADTVVARQCRGLIAALTLRHADGLLPLSTLGMRAVYARPNHSPVEVPIRVDATRLVQNSLTVAVPLPAPGVGRATVTWLVGDIEVARASVRGLSSRRFRTQVRVAEAGFRIASAGEVRTLRHPPPRFDGPIGPHFALAGRRGWAGLVNCEVRATGGDLVWRGRVLVTGESAALPLGMPPAGGTLLGFELRLGGIVVSTTLARPVPSATFTAEGKFAPPPDFLWTGAADDELSDRLGRLS